MMRDGCQLFEDDAVAGTMMMSMTTTEEGGGGVTAAVSTLAAASRSEREGRTRGDPDTERCGHWHRGRCVAQSAHSSVTCDHLTCLCRQKRGRGWAVAVFRLMMRIMVMLAESLRVMMMGMQWWRKH